MRGHFDGSPDPLSAERLRELIAACEVNIERLTVAGLHGYAAAHEERKRRYEKRLRKMERSEPK